jgi:nucleoside-diphosphate-sugar epimerase
MRVAVTGAAGFIGSSLCDQLLDDGHHVVGVDVFTDDYNRDVKESNLARARGFETFCLVEEDLLEADLDRLLDGIDVVFHLAGCPGVRASWGSHFETYLRGNVLATQRLLEAACRRPVGRFVYSSSSSVYGAPERFPTSESDLPQPRSPYGVSKLAGEHLCSAYHRNFAVPTVALRYFTVFGPRQRPDMAIQRLILAAKSGLEFELLGDGSQVRDFTFVTDVVRANVLAATSPSAVGEVVNIGGGSAVSMVEVIRMVEHLTDHRLAINVSSVAKGDVPRTQADTTRAGLVLGWTPTVDFQTGLGHQIASLID